MVVVDDLDGLINREYFLIMSEDVFLLSLRDLVHLEPVFNFCQSSRVLLGISLLISDAVLTSIRLLKGQQLPIELTLIDHAEGTNDLQSR